MIAQSRPNVKLFLESIAVTKNSGKHWKCRKFL